MYFAASGVSQSSPGGTETPYCASNCLAWYSWIFIERLQDKPDLQPGRPFVIQLNWAARYGVPALTGRMCCRRRRKIKGESLQVCTPRRLKPGLHTQS